MNLWKRYLFSEIGTVFLGSLLGFFLLYTMIESATRMDDLLKYDPAHAQAVITYHLNQFLKRADFLLPMSMVLSIIKVVTTLKARNEWTVLQTAGLSNRTLLRPFFYIACLCALFNWANFEYFLPQAIRRIETFRKDHFHGSRSVKRQQLVHIIPLHDASTLFYHSYLEDSHEFFDVFWVKNPKEIWHIKYLDADSSSPTGRYVDQLIRSEDGRFIKHASHDSLVIQNIGWNKHAPHTSPLPLGDTSISALFRLLKNPATTPYQSSKITTTLTLKLVVPLLPLMIALALPPFCLYTARGRSPFLLYALGVTVFLTLYMCLDALALISEQGMVSPQIMITLPIVVLSAVFAYRFHRCVV